MKSFGFVSRRAVKRPLLTAGHRLKRRLFANKFRRWTAAQWKNVVFSDEKLFRVRPGGQVRHWRQVSDSKYLPKYVVPTVSKPESLMVWAAMNGHGQIVLRRCPPGEVG